MKSRMIPIASMCALTVSYCAETYAANTAPASCFQTQKDYEIYQEYGDEAPSKPVPSATTGMIYMGPTAHAKALKDYEHGPAKRKEIVIKTTSSQTGKLVTIDASSSTTPSGQIEFAWGNDPTHFRAGDSKVSTEVSGSSGTAGILLIVKDPVCGHTESKKVTTTYN